MTAREVGGAELYVEGLVNALASHCEFTIALSDHPHLDDLRARLSRSARVQLLAFDRAASLPGIVRRLQRLAADHDVVHLNSSHPASRLGILMGFALGGRNTPVVCVEHRVTPVSDVRVPRPLAWCLPTLFRWSRRGVARVIAVSRDNARVLTQHYRLPASKVEVIYNGVEMRRSGTDPSAAARLRHELRLRSDQPIVLTLARLLPNKGHRFLIQAAPDILAHFPNVHFVLAGSPDYRAPIDRQIAGANLDGKFSILGFRTDVADLLDASDVFVLPSLAEGFALSISEALAAGLPTIATHVGGATEIIVDGENGFLIPPADAEALARAVKRVLSLDSAERLRLRQAALDTARRFSMQVTAQHVLDVYRALS